MRLLENLEDLEPRPTVSNPVVPPITEFTSATSIEELLEPLHIHGKVVIAHSSLKAFGWVNGGARTIVEGLVRAVGKEGTVVFPSFTGDNSDPGLWKKPPVASEDIRKKILETAQPHHPLQSTPWSRVGAVPQAAVLWPTAVRSTHPRVSFTAIGKQAQLICRPTEFEFDLPHQEGGPLGRLYELDTQILFLGTSWSTCTALHLCEHRLFNPMPDHMVYNEISVVQQNGKRLYAQYKMPFYNTSDFEEIGARFLEKYQQQVKSFAVSPTHKGMLIPMRLLVDEGTPLMKTLRCKN